MGYIFNFIEGEFTEAHIVSEITGLSMKELQAMPDNYFSDEEYDIIHAPYEREPWDEEGY